MLRKYVLCILLFWLLIPSVKGQESSALDTTISVRFNDISIPQALRIISRITAVNFSYNSNIISRNKIISSCFDVSVKEILEDMLELENLYYTEVNGNVVILKRPITEKSIIGQVIDAETKIPLQYASVFIDNSTLGIATDFNGYFKIDNVPDIRSRLVVSYLGYRSQVLSFPFEDEKDSISIELKEQETVLKPIVITGSLRKKRDRRDRLLLKRFKTDFLGRSENAKDCRIDNPHVLDFEVVEDTTDNYSASAYEPLIIRNMAMGYNISYTLDEFKFLNGTTKRRGQIQITELEPKSRRQNKKWNDARRKAYLGSDIHFLHSLLENNTFEQGFRVNVVRYDSANQEYSSPLSRPDLSEILSIENTGHLFQYQLNTNFDIEVTYEREYEDEEYVKLFRARSKGGNYKYTDQKSRSSISLGNNKKLTSYQQTGGIDISSVPLFQKSVISFRNNQPIISYPGYFNNVDDVTYLGWWTWGGFSEMLPINYRPGN